jgi:hypothetical protein
LCHCCSQWAIYLRYLRFLVSRDSSVGIATCHGLDSTRIESR